MVHPPNQQQQPQHQKQQQQQHRPPPPQHQLQQHQRQQHPPQSSNNTGGSNAHKKATTTSKTKTTTTTIKKKRKKPTTTTSSSSTATSFSTASTKGQSTNKPTSTSATNKSRSSSIASSPGGKGAIGSPGGGHHHTKLSVGGGGGSAAAATSGASGSAAQGAAPAQQGYVICTPAQQELLKQCDWNDKILWSTRLFLGGHAVNGFLRATAAAQRIKKQRARQTASTKKSQSEKAAAAAAAGAAGSQPLPGKPAAAASASAGAAVGDTSMKLGGNDPAPAAAAAAAAPPKAKSSTGFDPEEEEQVKNDIMNPRTAKKIQSELESGLLFCAELHNIMRSILVDIDPALKSAMPPFLSLGDLDPNKKKEPTFLKRPPGILVPKEKPQSSSSSAAAAAADLKKHASGAAVSSSNIFASNDNKSKPSTPSRKSAGGGGLGGKASSPMKKDSTKSSGTHHSSSLRRNRKKKLPPNPEAHIIAKDLPEFDTNGRRTCSKKDYSNRVFKLLRFRPLKVGDFCAARTSSRDLWILAKVLNDYPTGYAQLAPTPLEFLQVSDKRRNAMFKDNSVLLEDVEDTGSGTTSVARNLVLPLPRNFSEAADWASRLKKGSRVYGMYPRTTSLYPATVTDATTYCRGEDDIIVVEFDGEEADPATGVIPTYHIPARFVTLIPKEFPASEKPNTANSAPTVASAPKTSGQKRKSAAISSNKQQRKSTGASTSRKKNNSALDLMNMDLGGGGLSFDQLDLDFDKPLANDDNEDVTDTFMF